MADVLWGRYQREHITARHGVTAEQVDEAWHDPNRHDIAEGAHGEHGPYTRSIACTLDGRAVELLWHWDNYEVGSGRVFTITAYFVE